MSKKELLVGAIISQYNAGNQIILLYAECRFYIKKVTEKSPTFRSAQDWDERNRIGKNRYREHTREYLVCV